MIINKRTYVYLITQSTHARLEFADSKAEPSLHTLSVMNAVDLICHLWQHYVNVALFPLAAASVTIRREMSVFNNQVVSRVEGASNNLLQRLIDGKSSQDSQIPLTNKPPKRSFHGYLYNLVNRRGTISSPGMTTSHLPELTRNHVSLAAKFWKGFGTLRFKI